MSATVCTGLWCSGLGSSPGNSLQMGYADMCVNGTPVLMPVQ